MKSLRKAYRGERGFTLIELLVVIVILGVLAGVATLAVTRFIGRGNLEAARAELASVQTAINACLADAMSQGKGQFDQAVTGWTGGDQLKVTIAQNEVLYAKDYLTISGGLKGAYNISATGAITGADPGKWTGIKWENGNWVKA